MKTRMCHLIKNCTEINIPDDIVMDAFLKFVINEVDFQFSFMVQCVVYVLCSMSENKINHAIAIMI